MPLLTIGKVYHVSAFPNPGYKIKNVFVNTIDGQSHDITGHQTFRMQSDICGIDAEFELDNGEQPILGDDCYVYTTSDNQPLDIAICHWQSCINLGNGHGPGYTYLPALIDYSVPPLNEGFNEFAGLGSAVNLNPFTCAYNPGDWLDNLGPNTRHSYSYSDNVGIIQFVPSYQGGFGGTMDGNGDYLRSGTRLVFSRNLKTIKFPVGLVGLFPEALRGCPNLEEVTFSGTWIWMGAFADCPKLKILRLTNQTPPTIHVSDWTPPTIHVSDWTGVQTISLFENTPIEKIIVPNNQVLTYKQADGWIQFADKIVGDIGV